MSPVYSNLKETSNMHTHISFVRLCALCISKYWPHIRWAFSTKELSPDSLKRASKWQNTPQGDFWEEKEAWGSWRSCSDQRNVAKTYWKVVWTLAAFIVYLLLNSFQRLNVFVVSDSKFISVELNLSSSDHHHPCFAQLLALHTSCQIGQATSSHQKSQTNCFILSFCLKGQKFRFLVGQERVLEIERDRGRKIQFVHSPCQNRLLALSRLKVRKKGR